eukprot:212107-Pleurochrysis_carterae.AAC.7
MRLSVDKCGRACNKACSGHKAKQGNCCACGMGSGAHRGVRGAAPLSVPDWHALVEQPERRRQTAICQRRRPPPRATQALFGVVSANAVAGFATGA